MNRRAKSLVISLLVLVGIGAVILGQRDRGPVFQGRRTADWVARAMRDESRSAAFEAVVSIGAPAVPFIVRQGLDDPCHTFHFLSFDHLLSFGMRHPRVNRWLRIEDRLDNCVGRHDRAQWLLFCLRTNAQAAVPDLINCLERCPSLHYFHTMELLDTLGVISGTHPAAIPYLTRLARDQLNLRAAAVAYYINGQTNLLVETCQRLALQDPGDLLASRELFWFRDDPALNEHLIPLLEQLYTDPRSGSRERQSVRFELESRGCDAAAALARILAFPTNAPVIP